MAFSLVATAAAVATAFIGAGTASAEVDQNVVLCKKAEKLCSPSNSYPAETGILMATEPESPPAMLGTINEKCEKAHREGEVTSSEGMGDPLVGVISKVSLSGCKPCTTVAAEGGEFKLSMDDTTGAYTFVSSSSVKLTGCPLGVTCTFGGTVELEAIDELNGSPSIVAFEEEFPLTSGSSKVLCGSTLFWDAHFVISSPSPTYLSLLP